MTSTPAQSCIAIEVNRIAGLISRRFGVRLDDARMMVAQIIVEIVGNPMQPAGADGDATFDGL